MRYSCKISAAVTASLIAIAASSAQAQEASPNVQARPSGPDIVVTGTRASLENAEAVKRAAPVLIDGINADDIGQLPDVSISEALIRITGVSSNDTVRGSDQVAVRGLGPDLVSTEYNGRVLPTADGATRRVGLAGLPTEGISAAYAQKTADAQTIEGGVAGIIELQTVKPLDTRRHGLTLVFRGLYSDTANALKRADKVSPFGGRAEVSYIGKLADNFGVSFSYAGIKQYAAEISYQLDGWRLGTTTRADLNGDGVDDALPTTAGPFAGFFKTRRDSVIATAQWDPSQSVRVTIDGLYDRDHYVQGTRRYFAFGLFNGANGAPDAASVENDAATSFSGDAAGYRGTLGISARHDHTYEGGLNVAIDDGGPLTAKFDASYAKATRDRYSPSVNFENAAATGPAQRRPFAYDVTDPSSPSFTFDALDPADYAIQLANTTYQNSTDAIEAVRGDFTYKLGEGSFFKSVQWGFRVDHRRHTQAVDNTQYTFPNIASRPGLDDSYLETAVNPLANSAGRFGGDSAVQFPYYDLNSLLAFTMSAPNVKVNDQYASDVGAGADVREMSYELYYQANIDSGPLSGNVGLRYALTDEKVLGVAGTSPDNAVPQRFSNSYRYLLPSLNLRYEFTHSLLMRFAASKTISRPAFNLLTVGSAADLTTVPTDGVVRITRGNPNLQPFTSKGIDVDLEWYPDRHTSFAVAGYYKWVKNFTKQDTVATTVTLADGTVLPAFVTTSINDPATKHFKGIEVQARRDFDFLPGFLANLGAQANWNHNWTDERESFTSLVGSTVPVLPINFSKDVVNAQLFYSVRKLDLRLAYRYYSGYSRAFANGYQFNPSGQFDFNAGVTLLDGVRLIGSVTNLFKTKVFRTTADSRNLESRSLLQHYAYQGRQFTFGIRAQL